jgi:hypothetical protein
MTRLKDAAIGCPECAWGKVAGCWRCGSRLKDAALAAAIGVLMALAAMSWALEP